jgi:hypothetical protein
MTTLSKVSYNSVSFLNSFFYEGMRGNIFNEKQGHG